MTKLVLIFIALFIIGIESAPGDRIFRDNQGIARDRNSLIRKGNQDFWGKIFGQFGGESNIDQIDDNDDDVDDDDEKKPIEPKKKPVDDDNDDDDDDDVDEKDDVDTDDDDDDDDVAKPKKNDKKPGKKPEKPQRPQKPVKPTKPEKPSKDAPSYVLVPVRKGKVSIVYPNGKVVTKDIVSVVKTKEEETRSKMGEHRFG